LRKSGKGCYIGVDWFKEAKAVYVQPKVKLYRQEQVGNLAMLFSALQHPEVFVHTSNLFGIKWNRPEIQINKQQRKHDMLTLLLVLQYMQVLKSIVRKGIKKPYYKVESNYRSL